MDVLLSIGKKVIVFKISPPICCLIISGLFGGGCKIL